MRTVKPIWVKSLVKRFTIILSVCVCAAGIELPAFAQQTPVAATEPDTTLTEIVVTGTMIKRANAETAEAITLLKADVLKAQGITSVEQALNTLTSNTPSVQIASSVGSFSGGGTYANLRGLGISRTLVLLDGQRLAPNAFSGNAVDLSGIPFSAIEGVEVLREGASALYGSDAIAGVINFKTRRNFQGAEIQGDFDRPQHHGGDHSEVDVTFGHGDLASDGYNLMITGSFSKQNELQATARGFSQPGYNPALGVNGTSNNPGTWPGTLVDAFAGGLDGKGNFWQPDYPACPGNPHLVIDPANLGNTCAYVFSVATDLLPEHKETSGMVSFTKALTANNTVQLQYFYTRSEVTAFSGPEFYQFKINPANPFIPSASRLTCEGVNGPCGPLTLNVAGVPDWAIWTDPNNARYGQSLNTEQRALVTFSGTNAGWDYTAVFNYSKNKNDNKWTGGIPNEYLSGYPSSPPLAPGGFLSNLINPFGPQSAAGQALINSSYVNGTYLLGEDKLWSVEGHASHPLGDAFNAGTPATVALGANAAGERFESATTPLNDLTSAATGLTDTAVAQSRKTQALFLEVDVPMASNLDLDVSDREDRYSDFGRTNNAKLSLRYQPTGFLTLRGTASTGFRAPTLNNLYSPPFLAASSGSTMGQGNPLCHPPAGGTWTALTCGSQGIALSGGNSHLTPETSQNFDLGVIVSPITDMGITLDYYRILLKNTISVVPASAIYGDPTAFASYIVLNQSGGLTPSISEATDCTPYTAPTCGYILLTDSNTGRITTSGIDLSIQYTQHTAIGTFHEDLEGTAVTQFLRQQFNGGPTRNLVGWFNRNPPAYRWQHNLRVDWTSPEGMWGAGLSNRLYSTYIDEFPDGNGNRRNVGTYSLFDTYVSVKPIEKLTVLFGIKNLLDRNPPYTNAPQDNFGAGYNLLVADPLMRNFYVNLKYTFF
jgi:iron complex outermembrane receptor protein